MITERILLKIQKILIGMAFFMPLVVLPSSFIFPFIVPKIILFRSLVLLMVGVYGGLLTINWQKYRPRINPLTISVLAFWVSFAISTFVGVDWYRSFWDSHERMLGLFTVTHYILFYVILIATVRQEKDWNLLIRIFLGAGAFVMAVGLLQKIQPDLLLNKGSDRVSATLGNAIYMSGYGLFLLFFSVLSYVRTLDTERVWRMFALCTGILGFLGIFLGGTRGTFLGLVAGIGVMVVLGVIVSRKKSVRLAGIGVLLAGVVVSGLLYGFRETTFVSSIPAVGRIVTTDFAHIRENTRVMAWEVAWDGFLDKPVFGWGPNNYFYTFNLLYRPEFLRYGYGETWFDNAHNIVMNTLATQGILGILTYLSIFGVVGYSVFVARKRGQMGDAELIVLVGFFVGHFVHNIFVFENPTSYLYFFFALGYVSTRVYKVRGGDGQRQKKFLSTGAGVGIGIAVLLLIFVFNINPAKANGATLHAIQSLYRGEGNITTYMSAFSVPTPHVDDVRSDLARTVGQIVPQMVQHGKRDEALALIDQSIAGIEKNISLHPMDVRMYLSQAQLYQQRASITHQVEDIELARARTEVALQFSPQRQQLLFMLASYEQTLGNYDTALSYLMTARNGDTTIPEAWARIISGYQLAGKHQDALREIVDAQDAGIVFSDEEYATVVGIQRDK